MTSAKNRACTPCDLSDSDWFAGAALLAEKGVSGTPVIGLDGRVIGVISEIEAR